MRAERESILRIAPKVSPYGFLPDGDDFVLNVGVQTEIWVTQDIYTDRLALDVIDRPPHPWWQIWKVGRERRRIGIPQKGEQSSQFRMWLSSTQHQPIQLNVHFEHRARKDLWNRFRLELVLITGSPYAVYKVPISVDWDELSGRGEMRPLGGKS